jgi:hypothetical protein
MVLFGKKKNEKTRAEKIAEALLNKIGRISLTMRLLSSTFKVFETSTSRWRYWLTSTR